MSNPDLPHQDLAHSDLPREDDRTDSVPKVVPDYADADLRDLGERLAELYVDRESAPSDRIDEEIARIRARMRKGPRLHAGEFLQDGRYRLIQRTHRGSSDGYWRAWDRISGELVLVRVFHADWVTDPQSVAAFKERGDALERLLHPGIGGVLDASRSDEGFVYLATRYFESGDLAAAELDTIDAIQVAIEVGQALRYAHDHGVVHGDLRPQNVLLSADGAAHVVGFSIEPGIPSDGASLFRAPETTERNYAPAAAADVYALGMTAVAALNHGELPFWVLRDPGRLIRSLPVQDSVRAVLGRAVEWDLTVRYPTMTALLEDWLSDPDLVASLAVRARERDRHPIAAEHYENLLRIQPSRAVEIRTILGDVYTAMGEYDQAFDHLLSALERTSDVETLFPRLRVVAGHTGGWARLAETLWTQARARDAGRRVILRMELARVNHEELGNPVAAAETWSQVLADHRTPEQAGTALRALRDLAHVRQDWVGYVEYSQELLDYVSAEERPQLEYAIGRTYLEHLGNEQRGLEFIDRAELSGWSEMDLTTRLQAIRARRGQWRRVIQLMIRQAASQDIGEASPTLLRAGIIASSVHLEEDAFTVYNALLDRAPKHVVALRHVARLHHRAREHDAAMGYYERLWDTYKGRESEEPEASERAADCTAYATLLLGVGQGEEALERLAQALRLNANHVPALQLAGPLYLGRGDVTQASVVFERLLSLFKSVERSPQKIEACLGMGDLAWVQGRLTAAMGWYNRALELDPFSVPGWWGLAKVALASRGGHPGADRAPWVMAMPKRYTAQEALARLFAAVLDPPAMRAWIGLSPLGVAMAEGGETPMRAACALVDLMARNELLAVDLFERLRAVYPDWHAEIGEVEQLWLGGAASTFPVVRSYGWSKRFVEHDFDVTEARAVLPSELGVPPLVTPALGSDEAWHTLLSKKAPAPPEPHENPNTEISAKPHRYAGPIGALVRDGALWLALGRDQLSAVIGSSERADLRITDDEAIVGEHARLFRQGGRIYVEALPSDEPGEGKLQVDGDVRARWRLIGGERVTIGETRLQYQVFEDETRLPPAAFSTARGPAPAGADADRIDLEDAPVELEEPTPLHDPPRLAPRERAGATDEPLPPLSADRNVADERARLLEPTASLHLSDELRELQGEMTVPLAAVAEAVESDDSEITVDIVERLGSDLQEVRDAGAAETDGTEPDAIAYSQALPPLDDEPMNGANAMEESVGSADDDNVDDDPSEEEVIQALNGRGAPSLSRTPKTDIDADEREPVSVLQTDVDGNPHTAVISANMLREALADRTEEHEESRPTAWLRDRTPSGAPATGIALQDDDESSDGGDADDTTIIMEHPTPSGAQDGLTTEIASPPSNVFGFTEDGDDEDDVDSLASSPSKLGRGVSGPTMVPFERELAPSGPSPRPVTASRPPPARIQISQVPLSEPSLPTASSGEFTRELDAGPPIPGADRTASLEFMSGPERGRRVEVGDDVTVGQSRSCGVSIPSDGRLSPTHCRVERTRDGFVLTDQGSANGTVVNGQRVTKFTLHGGEVIMVGRTVLRFRLESA